MEGRGAVTHRVMLHVIRGIFFLVCAGIGSYGGSALEEFGVGRYLTTFILGACAVGGALIAVEVFVVSKSPIATISALIFGLLGGLIASIFFTLLVGMILVAVLPTFRDALPWLAFCLVSFAAIFSYLGIMVLLQTHEDFKFVIPYVEFRREVKGLPPVILDTSSIIDGRVGAVIRTGIFSSRILVPRSVVGELQGIAGSQDRAKRARGRRGLDILHELQDRGRVEVYPDEGKAGEPVDARLLALATRISGKLVTNDLGLMKRARLQGIEVVSVHELADALKAEVVPGETLRVRVIRPGDAEGQGVGFLGDGTMVVVEGGRRRIGREVSIEVTSAIQTSAGRMIFGRLRPGRPRRRGRRDAPAPAEKGSSPEREGGAAAEERRDAGGS